MIGRDVSLAGKLCWEPALALMCHVPQAVWEGKWRLHSNAYCALQLGAAPGERCSGSI